jgi:hypothetical protein
MEKFLKTPSQPIKRCLSSSYVGSINRRIMVQAGLGKKWDLSPQISNYSQGIEYLSSKPEFKP